MRSGSCASPFSRWRVGAQTEAVRAGRIVPVRVDQLIATRFARGRLVGAVGVRSLLERLRPRHRGEDGRTAGMRGRANHRVSHGRLGPKGLYGWKANNAPDRLTTSLGVCNG